MKTQYIAPETEVVTLGFEASILSYGDPEAPGRGFNGSNTNSYDDAF